MLKEILESAGSINLLDASQEEIQKAWGSKKIAYDKYVDDIYAFYEEHLDDLIEYLEKKFKKFENNDFQPVYLGYSEEEYSFIAGFDWWNADTPKAQSIVMEFGIEYGDLTIYGVKKYTGSFYKNTYKRIKSQYSDLIDIMLS